MMQAKPTAAQQRVAKDRRHTELVVAMQEAISILLAPFSPEDYIPGTIEDAVDVLQKALEESR